MADVINLYPKTSCPCANCGKNTRCFFPPNGVPTNMSVLGCKFPACLDCYDRINLGKNILEPQNKSGWAGLNPQVYSDKFDPHFGKVPCDTKCCPTPTYIAWDPRLYSATRADYTTLDRPPINGNVLMKDLYKKDLDNYGQGYTPYKDIRDGQIYYYVDRSIDDAYFKPVFAEPAIETAVLYKDPMGALKPEYTRTPVVNTENPTVTTPEFYPYCLSFIQDTQSFREDLMSYQMRKRNQQRWEPRWSNGYM